MKTEYQVTLTIKTAYPELVKIQLLELDIQGGVIIDVGPIEEIEDDPFCGEYL